MAIDYLKYVDMQNLVDERFAEDAKTNGITNQDFDFSGKQSVLVYDVGTTALTDYTRSGVNRYGTPEELDATTQEMQMTQDRAFTFTIDKVNEDETGGALNAGTALDRQLRERIIPEVDEYRFGVMTSEAGTTETSELTAENIYDAILDGTSALDEEAVPEDGRQLVVTPATFKLLKASNDVILDTEIGQEKRDSGVIAQVDGLDVIKVTANRVGVDDFGFMIAHPVATPAPVKIEEYQVHEDAPGISGSLVEGRVYYDAFVLDNKKDAIYVHIDDNNA